MSNDEMSEETAQRVAAVVRCANMTMTMTVQRVTLRLNEVLRVLNENPCDLYALARACGRKFPGDRGYRQYHFRRWVRGQEMWPW